MGVDCCSCEGSDENAGMPRGKLLKVDRKSKLQNAPRHKVTLEETEYWRKEDSYKRKTQLDTWENEKKKLVKEPASALKEKKEAMLQDLNSVLTDKSPFKKEKKGAYCMWQYSVLEESAGHSIEFKIYEFKSVDRQTIQKTELVGSKKFTNKEWKVLSADPLFPEHFVNLVSDKWQIEEGSDIEAVLEQKLISDLKVSGNIKDSA